MDPIVPAGRVVVGPEDRRAGPMPSRLFPGRAEGLLHADLHNHTLLSDGSGRAEEAYASMRAAGLDVAAITDHSFGASARGKSIGDASWALLGELADAADEDGAFVAIRGFEWSSPSLGHLNVWGSRWFTEPLPLAEDGVAGDGVVPFGPAHDPAAIAALHEWLRTGPDRAGGGDALVGFNHPGRETGRFGRFRYDARVAERVVGLEMFNRGDDYLFERIEAGGVSPLVECLDAGWRVGLTGVTDEHGTRWGFPVGLGRTGIWARGRDRAGVRRAMAERRMFATRERGWRIDAAAGGVPMGGHLAHDRGDVTFRVELDGGPDVVGTELRIQVLRTGDPLPTIVAESDVLIPVDGIVSLTAPIDRADGTWIVVRVTDPARPADPRAAPHPRWAAAGRTVAYASPFFLVAPPG